MPFTVDHWDEILRFAQNDRVVSRSKKLKDYLE